MQKSETYTKSKLKDFSILKIYFGAGNFFSLSLSSFDLDLQTLLTLLFKQRFELENHKILVSTKLSKLELFQ